MEKYIVRLLTLDKLIQRKSTGTPKDLAERLNISESTVYRLLKLLRNDMGLKIKYCHKSKSYTYNANSDKFDFERFLQTAYE